jgi:two-component system NarL family response regulator
MSELRVLLVDDHAIVRTGLRTMINNEPGLRVVGEASNGEEGITAYEQHRPDMVLMDLRMPGMGGVECTRAIRQRDPQAMVVVLTTYDGDEHIYQALRAGARAYLLKESSAEQFFEVLRSVHRGEYHLEPRIAERLARRLPGADLSAREVEVLRLVARGDINKEIAVSLGISESTVKNHLNNILTKLEVRDRTEAVTTALRRGYISLEER